MMIKMGNGVSQHWVHSAYMDMDMENTLNKNKNDIFILNSDASN